VGAKLFWSSPGPQTCTTQRMRQVRSCRGFSLMLTGGPKVSCVGTQTSRGGWSLAFFSHRAPTRETTVGCSCCRSSTTAAAICSSLEGKTHQPRFGFDQAVGAGERLALSVTSGCTRLRATSRNQFSAFSVMAR
jgi:hypothetical protein